MNENTQPSSACVLDSCLEIIRALAEENRLGSTNSGISLSTLLDDELGLDSLARLELLRRLESKFGVRPLEQSVMEAVTVADLLRDFLSAKSDVVLAASQSSEETIPTTLREDTLSANSGHMRRKTPNSTAYLYAIWAWSWFLSLAILAAPFMLVLPTARSRRRVLKFLARVMLFINGIPVSIEGRENLAYTPTILVSNHRSYADAVILIALLPSYFTFVAKRDFLNGAFFHWFFKKIGAYLIDRRAITQSERDLHTMMNAANHGQSLVFFPEGGFSKNHASCVFKSGAFVIAAQTACPITPIGLIGTDKVLPEGAWYPTRHEILIRFGPQLEAMGSSWKDIVTLRAQAEQQVRELVTDIRKVRTKKETE